MLHRRLRGFILVELLVAITIMGLIIAAAAISLTNTRVSARDAQRVSDGITINKAIEGYIGTERGQLPQVSGTDVCADDLKPAIKAYLPSATFPTDPKAELPGASTASYRKCYFYSKYSTSGGSNLAATLATTYVVQIGLEKPLSSDEAIYRTDAELGVNNASTSRTPVYIRGQLCSVAGCN